MSFTTLTTVKLHLLNSAAGPLHVEHHPVQLAGTADTELPHHSLVSASETVKRNDSNTPVSSGPHILSAYDWSNLTDTEVVPDTVVVALDSSCEQLFTEEVDYQIDYELGRIRRVPGTQIPDLTPVLVYYAAYRLFALSTDYAIDYESGKLHRTATGAIPDGGTVLVDYDVTTASVEDALVLQAIVEAEDVIARNLAPGYSAESTDQGLQTGATYLSLSIIARALCTEFLARRTTSDGATRAKEWVTLSERYEAKAFEVLRPFLNPISLRAGLRLTNE